MSGKTKRKSIEADSFQEKLHDNPSSMLDPFKGVESVKSSTSEGSGSDGDDDEDSSSGSGDGSRR